MQKCKNDGAIEHRSILIALSQNRRIVPSRHIALFRPAIAQYLVIDTVGTLSGFKNLSAVYGF